MRAVLGNHHAVAGSEKLPRGKRATVIDFPEGTSLTEALRAVTDPSGVWANHAAEDAKPAWVASDNDSLAVLLAEEYGCDVRDLEDPYEGRLDR
jgi:hypothetical protein